MRERAKNEGTSKSLFLKEKVADADQSGADSWAVRWPDVPESGICEPHL